MNKKIIPKSLQFISKLMQLHQYTLLVQQKRMKKLFIILFVISRYPKLLKAIIIKIYKNCCKPKNLYKFYCLKDCKNKDKDENIIFKHSQIKIKKVLNTFCNFRNTINIYLNKLLNYDMVIINFFEVIDPFLYFILRSNKSIIGSI